MSSSSSSSSSFCLKGDEIWNIGSVGEVCSGKGECVNNNTVCVCDQYWDGNSDFFPLEGHDCQNLVPLEQFLWSLTLVLSLNIWRLGFIAWRHQIVRFKYKSYYMLIEETRFLFLLQNIVIIQPCTIVACLLKIFTREQIGVDPALTFFIVIMVAGPFVVSTPMISRVLNLAVGFSAPGTKDALEVFTRRLNAFHLSFAVSYFLICFIPIFAPAVFAFPNVFSRVGMLVAKSLAMMLLSLVSHFAHQKVVEQLFKIAQSYRASNSEEDNNNSSSKHSHESVLMAIQNLRIKVKASEKRLFLVGILNIVMILPWLWPYQSYMMAILFSLSSGKNHQIRWLLPSGEADESTSENQQQQQQQRKQAAASMKIIAISSPSFEEKPNKDQVTNVSSAKVSNVEVND